MLNLTSNFKSYMKKHGRSINLRLTVVEDQTILVNKNIASIKRKGKGAFNKSIMTELDGELKGNYDLQNKTLKFDFGVSLNNSIIEWICLGYFSVRESEIIENEDYVTKFIAYDDMLKTKIDYVPFGVAYPISIKDYLLSLCSYLGINYTYVTFPNENNLIDYDVFINRELTFRDVFDEIAEATGSFIKINVDRNLVINQVSTPVDIVYSNRRHSLTVSKQKLNKINVVVLNNYPLNDNYYYPSVLPLQPVELKIGLNRLNGILKNNRSLFAPGLFNIYKDFEYTPFNMESKSIIEYEIGDCIRIKNKKILFDAILPSVNQFPSNLIFPTNISNDSFKTIVLETLQVFKGGYTSTYLSEEFENTNTNYQLASNDKRSSKKVYVDVNNLDNLIKAVALENDELSGRLQSVETILEPEAFRINVAQITMDAYGNEINGIRKNFTFDIDGLAIGSSENVFQVKINEQELGFYDNSNRVAYVNNSELNIKQARIEQSIVVGVHKIEKYDDETTIVRFIGVN